jgi:hypothetical protein
MPTGVWSEFAANIGFSVRQGGKLTWAENGVLAGTVALAKGLATLSRERHSRLSPKRRKAPLAFPMA